MGLLKRNGYRSPERGFGSRNFHKNDSKKELPDIYNMDIALEIEKERKAEELKALDTISGGRLAKRKKQLSY